MGAGEFEPKGADRLGAGETRDLVGTTIIDTSGSTWVCCD